MPSECSTPASNVWIAMIDRLAIFVRCARSRSTSSSIGVIQVYRCCTFCTAWMKLRGDLSLVSCTQNAKTYSSRRTMAKPCHILLSRAGAQRAILRPPVLARQNQRLSPECTAFCEWSDERQGFHRRLAGLVRFDRRNWRFFCVSRRLAVEFIARRIGCPI
ncbi:hypothetical protein B0H12DRAFT_429863 [Mycena haematopus]|nr:hypothetical protein B0H12DRAFT_429863 [Mycena haematopus]